MSWLTCLALQPPIVPRHSVLMQAMPIMIQTGSEEASQRGRCRSGGGARRRRSGLNTGLWYHSSYHSQYHIWYHRYDIDYDIIYKTMISWYCKVHCDVYDIIVLIWYHGRLWYHIFGLWYHTSNHIWYHNWYHRYDMHYDIIVFFYDIIVNIISMIS